ncbi:MAG: response regulator [Actinomycetota bacterium]|nr:response regulator [Actinomycetota bacterium]
MLNEAFANARIMIVDDEEPNVRLLERVLRDAGFENTVSTTDPREAQGIFEGTQPDLVLLDLLMPYLDGFALMEKLHELIPTDCYLPILVLTADATDETKRRALTAGAKDFLTKPLDVQEVVLRIKNMLETRSLHLQLQAHNELLGERVRLRTRELEEAQTETFERLALAAEYRDDNTGQHTRRVGEMAALLAEKLGFPPEEVELLERAAGLHDLGKIGVSDSILLAPRRLTRQEFEIVKLHTVTGAKILSGSHSPLLQMAEVVARSHHERWDGTGYEGLSGEAIPFVARITTVADVFDALTHERPYKEAWTVARSIEEIEAQRGRQFDPDVVDAFLSLVEHSFASVIGGLH